MKIAKIAVAAALILSLCLCAFAGCAGNKPETPAETDTDGQTADLLTKIREAGVITIAMEGTWAPWTYHDETDTLVGYDVEVGHYIAGKLGVEAQFIEGEWDGLLAGLEAGRYDIMINGVDVTPEREQKYDFSTPYAYNRTAVIVRGDDDAIKTMEDLNGKQTANTISSTYAEVTFYDYLKAHPDANVKIAAIDPDETSVAIPMRKGEETASLLAAVNDALAQLRADGTLTALSEKYFGTDISGSDR